MKKIILFTAVLALFISCASTNKTSEKMVYMFSGFREPADSGLRLIYSYDGYNWEDLGCVFLKPEMGTQKVMRDPSIAVGSDGTFHLVWTSSWRNDYGIGYSSSKDLLNWTPQRHIELMADFDSTAYNTWAPEFFYDDETGEFYIVWASSIKDKYPDDLPGESGSQRQYYTKTKDFKTFTPAELFFNPGFNSIDGQIVKRGTGDYVFVVKDNRKPGHSDLFTVFGPTPAGPWSDPSEKFAPEYSEGPTTIKIGDEWLIYFDVYKQYRFGAVSTKDFRTFTDISDKISIPKNHKHGTIFMAPESVLENLKKAAPKMAAEQADTTLKHKR